MDLNISLLRNGKVTQTTLSEVKNNGVLSGDELIFSSLPAGTSIARDGKDLVVNTTDGPIVLENVATHMANEDIVVRLGNQALLVAPDNSESSVLANGGHLLGIAAPGQDSAFGLHPFVDEHGNLIPAASITGAIMGNVTTSGIKNAGLGESGLMSDLLTDVRPTEQPQYLRLMSEKFILPYIDEPSSSEFGIGAIHSGNNISAPSNNNPAIVPTLVAPNFIRSPGDRDPGTAVLQNIHQPALAGSGPGNAVVTAYAIDGQGNSISIGSATADADGKFSITPTVALPDGSYSVVFDATLNGISSPQSSPTMVVIDTQATPPTLQLSLGSDSFGAGTTGTSQDLITNVARPFVSGTASPGDTVVVSDSSGHTVSTIADANGSYRIQVPQAMGEGTNVFTSYSVDQAGNTSAPISLTVRLDSTIVPLPAPTLDSSSDTGLSNSDDVTRATAPVFTGNGAEPGALVTIYANGVSVGQSTADASGQYTIPSSILGSDGQYQVTTRQTDIAGNVSAMGPAITVTVDTVSQRPTSLMLTSDTFGGGTAGTTSDLLTKDSQVSVTGVAEANSIVTLFDGTLSVGQATTNANGNWTVQTSSLTDGQHILTATAVDPAGNTSTQSGNLSVVVDTKTPTPALSLSSLSDSFGSGTSGTNRDNLTNVTLPVVHGTAEAGAFVVIYEGSISVGSALADNTGAWSTQLNSPLSGSASGIGHTLVAQSIDPAGNVSATSPNMVVTIDNATQAPTNPVLSASDADISPTGTTHNRPHFSGTAEAGSSVSLLDNGVLVGLGTADASGNWTIQSNALAAGGHTITSVAIDIAGNNNQSGPAVITVAQPLVTPPPPTLLGADDSFPINSHNNDDITQVTRPNFTGNTGDGFQVTLFIDGVSVGQGVADAFGNWTILDASSLTDGQHNVSVRVTDPSSGLSSAMGNVLAVVIDTVAPVAPSIALATFSDSFGPGTPGNNSDSVTNVTNPFLVGNAEANSLVSIIADNNVTIGQVTTGANGQWTLPVMGSLADGIHTLTATSYDIADNASTSVNFVVTIDTSAAALPALVLLPTSDSGASSSDHITNAMTPTFTGTGAEANALVVFYANGISIGEANANAAGSYTFAPPASLGIDGIYQITTRQTDIAGNVSGFSPPTSVTLDTVSKQPLSLTLIDDTFGVGTAGTTTDLLTKDSRASITGVAEANSVVTLFDGTLSVGQANVDASGNWTLQTSSLADGQHTLTVTALDIAGNTSISSANLKVTVDTTITAPTINLPNLSDSFGSGTTGTDSDNLSNVTRPGINGTAEAGAFVVIFDGATSIGSAIADASGNWSTTISTSAVGIHSLTASSIDPAGNTSATSNTLTVTIDVSAATANTPILMTASDSFSPLNSIGNNHDNITNQISPLFTGVNQEAGGQVILYDNGVQIGSATSLGAIGSSWTIAPGNLFPGQHFIQARYIDTAGNVGGLSSGLAVTIDNNETPPQNLQIAAASDSGSSNTDRITAATTPTITGQGNYQDVVVLTAVNGAVTTTLGMVTVGLTGNWSVIPSSMADGTYTVDAVQIDPAGNISNPVTPIQVVIDTRANPPTLLLSPVYDTFGPGTTGTNGDSLTNNTAPFMIGVAEPGARVTITENGVVIGTVNADSVTGSYSVQATPMSNGIYTFQATQIDLAGNSSVSTPNVLVTVDTVAATPTLTGLTPATDTFGVGTTGTTNDALTRSSTIALQGTAAEMGAALDLYRISISGSITTTASLAHAVAGAGGSYTFAPVTAPATDGTYSYITTEIDPAGNVSPISPIFAVVIDRTAAPPPISLLNDTRYAGNTNWSTGTQSNNADYGTTADLTTQATKPQVTGTAEVGSLVSVFRNGVSIGQAVTPANGSFTFSDPLSLSDGSYTYTANQLDRAGNLSNLSANLVVTVDTMVGTAHFVTVPPPAGASASYYGNPIGIPALANGLNSSEIYNVDAGGHTGVPVYFQIDPATAAKSKVGDIVVVDFTFTYANGTAVLTQTSEATYAIQAADLVVTAGNTPTLTTWITPNTFFAGPNWENTYVPINKMTVQLQVRDIAGNVGYTNTPNVDVIGGDMNASHVNAALLTLTQNVNTGTWLGNGVQVYRELGRPADQLGSQFLVGDDLNNDGLHDLFISAPANTAANSNGRMYVVAAQPDTVANGTGFVDLQNVGTTAGWGEAHGNGGATGGVVWTGVGSIGTNLTFVPDMDGDGKSELVANVPIGAFSQGNPVVESQIIYSSTLGAGGWAQAFTSGFAAANTTRFFVPQHTDTGYSGKNISTDMNASFGMLAPHYDINGDGVGDAIFPDGGIGASGTGGTTVYGNLLVGFTPTAAVGGQYNLTATNTALGLPANKGFYIYSTDPLHPLGESNAIGLGQTGGLWEQPIGDLNGDGLKDIVVGQSQGTYNSLSSNGRVDVVFGRKDGLAVDVNNMQAGQGFHITWNSATNAGDIFGYQVKVMDLNSDGYDDLTISVRSSAGANSSSNNTFDFVIDGKWLSNYVSTHQNDPLGVPDIAVDSLFTAMVNNTPSPMGWINGDPTNTNFSGNANYPINTGVVTMRTDLNGDGYQDAIVRTGTQDYVLLGSPDYQAGAAGNANHGTSFFQQSNHLMLLNESGAAIQFADINGDGLWDMVVGQSGNATDGTNAGIGYVVYGTANQTGAAGQSSGSPLPFASSYTNSWTAGADTITGTSGRDMLNGGQGDDIIAGNGGIDVLQGGGGNDIISVNASNITNFLAPGSYWDGGISQQGEINSLQLNAAPNAMLDLTTVSAGNDLLAHIHNIERFDLNGNGSTLKFDIRSVLDTSSMGVFLGAGANGETWSGSTWDPAYTTHPATAGPLAGNVAKKQWVIDGDSSNTVDFEAFISSTQPGASPGLTGNWTLVGHVAHNDLHGVLQNYNVYDFSGSNVEVIINQQVNRVHAGALPGW